jgi:hypothetical protein
VCGQNAGAGSPILRVAAGSASGSAADSAGVGLVGGGPGGVQQDAGSAAP